MASFASVKARYGLSAIGTPTGTQVGGSNTIGIVNGRESLTGADVFYAFKVTATGGTDVARLTLSTGAVTQETGTPTLTDAGVDFEGESLAAVATVNGVLVIAGASNSGEVDVSFVTNPTLGSNLMVGAVGAGGILERIADVAAGSCALDLTFDAIGDEATVIVAGTST